jgi:amino acid transporter
MTKPIDTMLVFLTTGFLYDLFRSGELPEANAMEPSGQLLEFLATLLAVFSVAVVVMIVVVLFRSRRLKRLKNPVKEYTYKRKH